jgi:hypothetical protein
MFPAQYYMDPGIFHNNNCFGFIKYLKYQNIDLPKNLISIGNLIFNPRKENHIR